MKNYGHPLDDMLPNPFTNEYLRSEIEFYGGEEYDDKNGARLILKPLPSIVRLDDYLNKALRGVSELDTPIPMLYIDKRLWMSLTWMEVQSNFCPIHLSAGIVGTAGLGMGYYALRAAGLDEVERVDAYEIDPRVINYFKERFKNRPEFKKIHLIEGDARELIKDKEYDFLYVDIYPTLLGDEVLDDVKWFSDRNHIDVYHFWGIEKILLAMLILSSRSGDEEDEEDWYETVENIEICSIHELERWYFSRWFDTEGPNLYDYTYQNANQEFINEAVETLVMYRPERV